LCAVVSGSMRERCPYYKYVPRSVRANLMFRRRLISRAFEDRAFARELWVACSRDLLFFVNTFCWLYEPRTTRRLPFITFEYQNETFLELDDAIQNGYDVCCLKSRDVGASWMCVTIFFWHWLFHDMYRFGGMSEKEELVDRSGDPKSMFWKFDFLMENLPCWMRLPDGKYERTARHARNLDNGSTFDGQTTTTTSGTGDRCTAMILDEFSKMGVGSKGDAGFSILRSTRDVTPCRIFNFTPNGHGNAAYRVAMNSRIRQIRLHWSRHPYRSAGLYTSKNGKLILLDRAFRGKVKVLKDGRAEYVSFPDEYTFILDGKIRSPYYDFECAREDNPINIAQELDMDFHGSSSSFFGEVFIDELMSEVAVMPYSVGRLEIDYGACEVTGFQKDPNGNFYLWCTLDGAGKPPDDRHYVVGCDISMGTGASNSALAVFDCLSNEKVAEYVDAYIQPHDFAKFAVAVCRWFQGKSNEGALLIWEQTGAGRSFGEAVRDAGYGNIWHKRNADGSWTKIPGWYPSRESKIQLLTSYRYAMRQRLYLERSIPCLEECRAYIFMPGGGVDHVASQTQNALDPSGARTNHGDRVIASALTWLGAKHYVEQAVETKPKIPANCFESRRRDYVERMRRDRRWSNSRREIFAA